MSTSQEIADSILNLSPEQFFRDDPDLNLDLQRKFLKLDFEGLALAAPRTVEVSRPRQLPVVIGTRKSLRRGSEVIQSENLVLAGTDLATGEVRFGQALFDPKAEIFYTQPVKPPPPDPPPPGTNITMEGFSSQIYRVDAAERLDLPWQAGKLALTAISYDWVSNTVQVEITGGGEPEAGPVKPVSPLPPPADDLPEGAEAIPNYEPNDKTPRAPREGCAFVIDQAPPVKAKLLVRGAFSLAAKPHMVAKDPEIIEDSCGQKFTAAVVVPVTFAVLALDWRTPRGFDWAVPVCSEFIHKPGDRVAGAFAIDALAESDPFPPGDYLAYILCDGVVSGPVKFKIEG